MADEQTQVQDQFHAFLKQRNNKTNVVLQEAQKLINLYRVLNDFGPEFMAKYNAHLLTVSDEVNAGLAALVGGEEVRQYIEFIKQQNRAQDDANDQQNKRGYLPDPSADVGTGTAPAGNYVSRADFDAFVSDQNNKLKELMDQLKAEQNAVLTRLAEQVAGGAKKDMPSHSTASSEYSEIIEETK